MAKYVDENGTVSIVPEMTEQDRIYGEMHNQAKIAAEEKRKNDLYENELRIIRKNGMWSLLASVIAALAAVLSAMLQILG